MTTSRTMCDELPPAEPKFDRNLVAYVTAMLDGSPLDPAVRAKVASSEAVATREQEAAERRLSDWPELSRYRAANAQAAELDLVMIGDSITEIWGLATPNLFGTRVINRGVGGQTSAQILLRFMADVIDLQPRRVHILCGTNDIAGNTGPSLPVDYQRNIRAMVTLAQANDIGVLLASIPPAATIPWSTEALPLTFIPRLNAWLRDLADAKGLTFVDYHAILDDGAGGLREEYSADGVHVTRAAYRAMHAELMRVMND